MSRAQNVWSVSVVAAAAAALAVLSLLPFSFWMNAALAILAFVIISGVGRRYFLKHATADEIRRDLQDRKSFPG